MTNEEKIIKLEEKLEKIADVIKGTQSKTYNLDALKDKKVMQVMGTVRLKDAILVFPTLTKADQADRESRGLDLVNLQTLIAIPNDEEVLSAFRAAFADAFNFAIKTKVLPEGFNINSQEQNPFIVNIDEWLSKLKDEELRETIREMLKGKKLLKNCKIISSEESDRPTILLNKDGEEIPQSKITGNLCKAEICLSFGGYNKAGKKGIGRYLQGLRIMDEGSAGNNSIFF